MKPALPLDRWHRAALVSLTAAICFAGCSIKKLAVNRLGDAFAQSGTSFASDDDPQLIRDATPFSLKLIEGLLLESPRHKGLLLAAASGFTQYGYAFVQEDADETEDADLDAAVAMRARARRLYMRGRGYAIRGLEEAHPGFERTLINDPEGMLRLTTKADVPFLYWTAASWGAAISVSKDDPRFLANLPIVGALAQRALALDETFDHGAIHEMLISYEAGRPAASGGSLETARGHFDRALALSGSMRASTFLSLAESVSVKNQNKPEFETLMKQALAIDADARPEWRLANLIMQRRARWLLGRLDQLFVE